MPTEAEISLRLKSFEDACKLHGVAFSIALNTRFALVITQRLWLSTFQAAIVDCQNMPTEEPS